LNASDGVAEDWFGYSVSINGIYAVAGAIYNDDSKGAAYIFSKPIPKIHSCGCLCWCNAEPGETVTGEFMVYNIGEPGSELNWEITSHPSWGKWTFIPTIGTGLTPETSPVKVDVEVIAPEGGYEYTGEVIVNNTDDDEESCNVTAILSIDDKTPPTIKIIKPVRGRYFLDELKRRFLLPRIPRIFGDITVIVNATDNESGIDKVVFYGGLFGTEKLGEDKTAPYNITWVRSRIRLIHFQTLKVYAYNNAGHHASKKIVVRKIL
jgi:hypothetical protein